MEYLLVGAVALLASGLTFFTGFGMGTVLMPVLALFFPVPVAIAATAVVHFADNLFKLLLVGRSVDVPVLVRFGVPAAAAALAGASLLSYAAFLPVVARYRLAGGVHEITAVKLLVGVTVTAFAVLELVPRFADRTIDRKHMAWGGLLSGFFGGLSGNQGALRSMFLIRAGLGKEGFIATGVAASLMVDVVRLAVYGSGLFAARTAACAETGRLLLVATIPAFAGALLGRLLLKKVTMRAVRTAVGALLGVIGLALSAGLI